MLNLSILLSASCLDSNLVVDSVTNVPSLLGSYPALQRQGNLLKPVSHQPCGSGAPICDDKFLGFVRQPHSVVNNTARLPYEKQGRKAAATNFRHVHFLCNLFAFSERRTPAAKHTRLSQDCCKTHKVFVRLTL